MGASSTPIDNSENIIDTRDVQHRIWYLEFLDDPDLEDPDFWEDEREELDKLQELESELTGYGSLNDGMTMVRESYFTEYAMQYAEDLGAIPSDASWPATCIDWDQAANDLQMDYSAVEFDGVTYYVR